MIALGTLQRRLNHGPRPRRADIVLLAEALRERLPDDLGEDSVRYDTEDPLQTARDVSTLCHWIAALYEREQRPPQKQRRRTSRRAKRAARAGKA